MKDTRDGSVFARKIILNLDRDSTDLIANETNTISKLCAPGKAIGVVEVFRHGWFTGELSNYFYFDMEYCPQTLEHWLHQAPAGKSPQETSQLLTGINFESEPTAGGNTFLQDYENDSFNDDEELAEVLQTMEDIAAGLECIHDYGLAHRDLKPSNGILVQILDSILTSAVLFSERSKRWKIADFGIACNATSGKMLTTILKRGTTSYRAPEVLTSSGKFNKKSDIFAFGCIIFEIVTLQRLFADDWNTKNYETTGNLGEAAPVYWEHSIDTNERSYDHIEHLMASMLEIDPSRRPSAKDVLARIRRIRNGSLEDLIAWCLDKPYIQVGIFFLFFFFFFFHR